MIFTQVLEPGSYREESRFAISPQDPADWMPPSPEAQCRYVGEWLSTKLRWELTAD